MGSRPNAALMGCCLLTDSDRGMIDPTDDAEYLDQLLMDLGIEEVTDYEGEGPSFLGHTYVARDWENSDLSIDVDLLKGVDLPTAKALTLRIVHRARATITEPEGQQVCDRLLLFLTLTDTWAFRLVVRYG